MPKSCIIIHDFYDKNFLFIKIIITFFAEDMGKICPYKFFLEDGSFYIKSRTENYKFFVKLSYKKFRILCNRKFNSNFRTIRKKGVI